MAKNQNQVMPLEKRTSAAMVGDEEPRDSHGDRTPEISAPVVSPTFSPSNVVVADRNHTVSTQQADATSHAISPADELLPAVNEGDADDIELSHDADDEDDGASIPDDDEEAAPSVEEVDETEGMKVDEANAGSNNASVAGGEEVEVIAAATSGEDEHDGEAGDATENQHETDVGDDSDTGIKEEGEEDGLLAAVNAERKKDVEMKEEEEAERPMARGTSMHDNDLFEEHWELESRDASPVNDAEHDATAAFASTFAGDGEEEEQDAVHHPMVEGTSMHSNDLFEEHWELESRYAIPARRTEEYATDTVAAGDQEEEEEDETVAETKDERKESEEEEEGEEEDERHFPPGRIVEVISALQLQPRRGPRWATQRYMSDKYSYTVLLDDGSILEGVKGSEIRAGNDARLDDFMLLKKWSLGREFGDKMRSQGR